MEESEDPFARKNRYVAFYDTHDLQLRQRGYVIRKRTKIVDGERDDEFTLTLKFKSLDHAVAVAADVGLAEGYVPKDAEIEVEADIIDAVDPDGEMVVGYSVANSTKMDRDVGGALGDYADVFPVLGALGVRCQLQ